ncbi:SDR family oxidoreductase [Stutzerimonas urumqiensis]|uniref:SDR family NAD(P)-dependent oxidoreductase n=1 Tax=Stutzerimonas urumqiensis TaxID=638269 RepID=UPI003DA47628
MSNEFAGRLCVVTGASSGIGLAVTRRLLEQGARVIAMARSTDALAPLAAESYGQLITFDGNVTRPDDLAELAETTRRIGPVACVVPNAGVAELADALDCAAFERQWAVNGAGALNTLAALRPHLCEDAAVVFIGTFLANRSFPGLGAYIATKAALIAQARTLAVELAASGIRINTVSPGPTATAIWGKLGVTPDALAGVAEAVDPRLLGGGFLEADAVADVVLFQLSQGARGVYGQDWVVDKGYTLA